MTVVELWDVIQRGGVAALAIAFVVMVAKGTFVTGRENQREVDRNIRLEAVIEKYTDTMATALRIIAEHDRLMGVEKHGPK